MQEKEGKDEQEEVLDISSPRQAVQGIYPDGIFLFLLQLIAFLHLPFQYYFELSKQQLHQLQVSFSFLFLSPPKAKPRGPCGGKFIPQSLCHSGLFLKVRPCLHTELPRTSLSPKEQY